MIFLRHISCDFNLIACTMDTRDSLGAQEYAHTKWENKIWTAISYFMHSSTSNRDSISQCNKCERKEWGKMFFFLLTIHAAEMNKYTYIHTVNCAQLVEWSTIRFRRRSGSEKKFNLIIIIISNFLAYECLFLFATEMEVILAIIILLCTRYTAHIHSVVCCSELLLLLLFVTRRSFLFPLAQPSNSHWMMGVWVEHIY